MASGPASAPPGGGSLPLLRVRSIAPLPSFSIPHPIPSASDSISAFKLSILSILTLRTNPASATSSTPLFVSASERLKMEVLEGWRREMVLLELRQNAVIAPETRNSERAREMDQEIVGFVLEDHHDCGLLEEGDEVLVRIKAPHTLASLKLPPVPSGHTFGLPPGSLTRAGTLSAPPPYSEAAPREPSSHSSSVAGQPNANFHQYVYRDAARGVRVMTTQQAAMQNGIYGGVSGANRDAPANGQHLGVTGANGLSAPEANPRRLGPSRRASAGINGMPKPGAYKPPPISPPPAESSAAAPRPLRRPSSRGNVLASTPEVGVVSSPPHQQHFRSTSFGSTGSPATSFFPATGSGAAAVIPAHRRRNTSDEPGKGAAAAAAAAPNGGSASPSLAAPSPPLAMPSTALVIGPGVQGRFGNTPAEPVSQSIQNADYGNVKHFASFTAAGGEVRPTASSSKIGDRTSEQQRLGGVEGQDEVQTATPLAQSSRENAAALAAERGRGKRKGSYDQQDVGSAATPGAPPPLASPPILENERDARSKAAADAADRRAALARTQTAQRDGDVAGPSSMPAAASKDKLPPTPVSTDSPSAESHGYNLVHAKPERTQQEIDEQLANDAALALALSEEHEAERVNEAPASRVNEAPASPLRKHKSSRPSMGGGRPSTGTSASLGSASYGRPSDARSRSYSNGARSSQTGGGGGGGGGTTPAVAPFDRYVDAQASGSASPQGWGEELASREGASREGASREESFKKASSKSNNGAARPTKGLLSRLGSSNSDKPNALTSADRKFLARRASLDREVARQEAAEAARKRELERGKRKKEEAAKRQEEVRKKEKYAKQWEVWEEVGRRERKAGLPPPDVVERDVGG